MTGQPMTSRPNALLLALTLAAFTGGCSRPDAPPASNRPVTDAAPVAARAAAPAPAETRPRIVFLGDSLTAGLGLDPEQSIPSLFQQQLDAEGYSYEVVNAGVSGDTSAGGLRRLDWSLDGPVQHLVVELGANDGLRGLPVADTKHNLEAVVSRAKARGITVVMTGMEAPPNYGQAYTSEFRKVFKDVAAEQHVAFVPFFLEGVAGDPALNQGDGIHPNPAGARIVNAMLWTSIKPLLEKQD
jgi:acyl-CoA thioesterase I